MNRRHFTKILTAAGFFSLALRSFAGNSMLKTSTTDTKKLLSSAIAGITVPDSKYVNVALDEAKECSAPYLFNHAARTFYFGALLGRFQKMSFDLEMLFIACILHDLGFHRTTHGRAAIRD